MGTLQWLHHFERSVARERRIDWSLGWHVRDELAGPLVHSLRTFQRGLSSPGNNLRTKVREACESDYASAMDLYVREKNIHADLLAKLLWAAGSQPRSRQWTDFVFRRLRRRFDWTHELMVLLTAEMASVPFFRVISNSVPDPLVRQVMESILHDQAWHLGFHIEHLREELRSRPSGERAALQQSWSVFFSGTLLVLMSDNRSVFEALHYEKLTFWTDAINLFTQVQTGLNGSQHLAALLSRDPRLKFVL